MAYTLYMSSYDKHPENDSYAGLCYGRGSEPATLYYVHELNVVSGFLKQHLSYCRESRKFEMSGKFHDFFILLKYLLKYNLETKTKKCNFLMMHKVTWSGLH